MVFEGLSSFHTCLSCRDLNETETEGQRVLGWSSSAPPGRPPWLHLAGTGCRFSKAQVLAPDPAAPAPLHMEPGCPCPRPDLGWARARAARLFAGGQ